MPSNLVIPALSLHPLATEFPTRYALANHASMSMPLYSLYESDSLASFDDKAVIQAVRSPRPLP